MGQRQDLLRGAKKCLAEKGYAHTTARDIVAASGANLAAIGYHFGSKDALLNAAVMESFDEWGALLEQALTASDAGAPADRLAMFLTGLLDGAPERRGAIVASVQAFAQAEFAPDIKAQLAAVYDAARRDVAAMLFNVEPAAVNEEGLRIGSLVLAVINGMMLQWLVAPDVVATGAETAAAIRSIVQGRLPG